MSTKRISAGFTLVEMIVAIVIIGIAVAGVMVAFSVSVRGSADAVVGKQMIAVAESMMEEVLLKPFDEPRTGAGANGSLLACGTAASRATFDEVLDYNGYRTSSVCAMDGSAVAGLEGYAVSVAAAGVSTFAGGSGDSLRITVTVARGGSSFVLTGFRTRYGGSS